jgi:hypothetical protein
MGVDIYKRKGLNLAPRTFLMSNGATIVARFAPAPSLLSVSQTQNVVAVHDLSETSEGSPAPWRRLALRRVGDAIYCVCRPTYATYVQYSMTPDDGTLRTDVVPFTALKTVACVLDTNLGGVLCLEHVCVMLSTAYL